MVLSKRIKRDRYLEIYIKNKRFILESTRGHDLMFYIMAEENRPIIKRRIDDKGGYSIRS